MVYLITNTTSGAEQGLKYLKENLNLNLQNLPQVPIQMIRL